MLILTESDLVLWLPARGSPPFTFAEVGENGIREGLVDFCGVHGP